MIRLLEFMVMEGGTMWTLKGGRQCGEHLLTAMVDVDIHVVPRVA